LECEDQTLEEAKNTTDGNAWIEPIITSQQPSYQQEHIVVQEETIPVVITSDEIT